MRIKLFQLCIYILITSLFLPNFITQYFALFVVLIIFIATPSTKIKRTTSLTISMILIGVATLSYIYNFLAGNADILTFVFWLFSYLPPFVLIWYISSIGHKIDFYKSYSYYKKLVYIQCLFLIMSAIRHKTLVVGDPATGTIGDANWVAFHLCVVILYEVIKFSDEYKNKTLPLVSQIKRIAEIMLFFIIMLIPESTANIGFLILVLGIFITQEYILKIRLKPIALIFSLFLIVSGIGIVTQTYIFERFTRAFRDSMKFNVLKDYNDKHIDRYKYNYTKINFYRFLLSGKLYSETNFLIGSGPSTFTSRSSLIRMPKERTNSFPIDLPYFKSDIFKKFIAPMYAEWRKTGESYGNFASPQTTIISISIELGILGLLIFSLFFYTLFQKIQSLKFCSFDLYLKKFAKLLLVYFVISLLHLNFWEYPIMSFTFIIFTYSIIYKIPQTESI